MVMMSRLTDRQVKTPFATQEMNALIVSGAAIGVEDEKTSTEHQTYYDIIIFYLVNN